MADLRSRPAGLEDYAQFLRSFAELAVPDVPPDRDRWERENLASTLIFELDGRFAAYAFFETLEQTGYLRQLVVDPRARGRGVARAVMDELRARFQTAGCKQWCLNVKPDNLAAIRVYERVGMHAVYRSHALRLAWSSVSALPAVDAGWIAESPPAAEDAELESAFALDRGLIAARRGHTGMRVLVLRGSGRTLGLACFDPYFPGAFPFAADSPGVARGLLEGLQPSAAGAPWLALVVQDDAELCRALQNARNARAASCAGRARSKRRGPGARGRARSAGQGARSALRATPSAWCADAAVAR
jgi:GNAT superfamily N-acetyltransferase